MLGRGEEGLVELGALKSLKNWDIGQPRSLVEIVSELMQCYKETQKRAVLAFPSERIHFELSLIQDRPATEFLLLQSPEHGAEVRLLRATPFLYLCPHLRCRVDSCSATLGGPRGLESQSTRRQQDLSVCRLAPERQGDGYDFARHQRAL